MEFLILSVKVKVPVVWMHATGSLLRELLLGKDGYPSLTALTAKSLQRCVPQTLNALNSGVFFNLSKTPACDTRLS